MPQVQHFSEKKYCMIDLNEQRHCDRSHGNELNVYSICPEGQKEYRAILLEKQPKLNSKEAYIPKTTILNRSAVNSALSVGVSKRDSYEGYFKPP